MAEIIDGKKVAEQIKGEICAEAAELKAETGITPGLAVILVGNDPASEVYVRNKKLDCEKCGIVSFSHTLPEDTKQDYLISLIKELNADGKVHGILCQLPVPKHIDENAVLLAIDPAKDVDGFHPINVGKFMTLKKFSDIEKSGIYLPCTPAGCIELLDRYNVPLDGADAVVIGRSNIVGKPAAMLLMAKNATVTICHSRTKNLPDVVRRADVVVAAIGSPEFVKGDWIKKGAAVIDVGVNRIDDPSAPKGTRLVGDVEFKAACENAACVTPVPGGVGLMTRAMLMRNTLSAARRFASAK